jgi:pyruvate dehydrogenase E1 component alpha subunit
MATTQVRPEPDFLDAPITIAGRAPDLALGVYERMVLIRGFEQRANTLFLQGRLPGTIHLSLGQEACAVGATWPLRVDDWITITHRGHGQALAKGVSPRSMMAELFARDTGCCRGHGGSLHVGDLEVGALPGIAIVGASVPIAAGIGLAFRRRGEDRVAVCFLGDGAVFEGDTHEGINLAALWDAPVVYVCENNLYSISTHLRGQTRVRSLAAWARSYGLHAETVDGNDVTAVLDAAQAAVDRARAGAGPSFVECLTYRQGGHKRDDPATYRDPAEVARWLARDPIARMRSALDLSGLGPAADDAERAVSTALDEAVAFAEASPPATAPGS